LTTFLPDLARGAASVFRGAALAARPGVRHYAYIPLAINVLVFAGLIWLSGALFDAMMEQYLGGLTGIWGSLLRWILWAVFSAAMLVATFFTFTLVANLVGAPFNEALSAAVADHLATRDGAAAASWGDILAAFPSAIGQELNKWVYFARWLVPAGLLFFVPVVQVIAPLIWGALAAWFVGLEYAEYPAARDRLDFKALRERARPRRALLWGFGGTVSVLALIPGVNLVLMPVAVAGATVLWVEHLQRHST